jgi:hypothetical protein
MKKDGKLNQNIGPDKLNFLLFISPSEDAINTLELSIK